MIPKRVILYLYPPFPPSAPAMWKHLRMMPPFPSSICKKTSPRDKPSKLLWIQIRLMVTDLLPYHLFQPEHHLHSPQFRTLPPLLQQRQQPEERLPVLLRRLPAEKLQPRLMPAQACLILDPHSEVPLEELVYLPPLHHLSEYHLDHSHQMNTSAKNRNNKIKITTTRIVIIKMNLQKSASAFQPP